MREKYEKNSSKFKAESRKGELSPDEVRKEEKALKKLTKKIEKMEKNIEELEKFIEET